MRAHQSRRQFVRGVAGGALIIGFDPTRRSWVTEARAGDPLSELPPLDGTLTTAPAARESFGADFGRIVSRLPRAVLRPGSVQDVVRIVRFARTHRIAVAANGQAGSNDMRESHSNFGQAQVEAGIAIDMGALAAIHAVGPSGADVQGGARWSEVFDAAEPLGLTPPVLTDYLHLSVGGTLSVGGISGASQHFGVQADNVAELDVVTGRGDLVRCSSSENSELFEAGTSATGSSPSSRS
jgi:FAD/FMN-containing dehydrogenase